MINNEAAKFFQPPVDEKLRLSEKIAYGIGDTAGNILFGTMSGMIAFFYTDYMGMSAAIIGIITLISRFTDGISDFIMGFILERTKSKYGKARPWILRMVVPFCLSIVALFFVPAGASNLTKGIYVFITYNFAATICFTAINLPYSALSSLMTRDTHERTELASYRMGMAPWGRVLAVSLTLPFVEYLGNDQGAWIKVMSIWAVLALLMFLYTFLVCKERVEVAVEHRGEKIPFKKSVKALFANKYWIAVSILWGITMAHYALIGATLPYYSKYIFGDANLYGVIYTAELLCFSIAAIYTPYLSKKFTKRNICLAGAVIGIVAQAVFLLNPASYITSLVVTCIRSLGFGPIIVCVFSMMGDCVEYGQWKSHIRQEGMIFSASGIGSKAGSGIASGVIGVLLARAGYISSMGIEVAQPESALAAIQNIYHFGIILIWGVAAIILIFWQLDKKYPKIMKELAEREAKGLL